MSADFSHWFDLARQGAERLLQDRALLQSLATQVGVIASMLLLFWLFGGRLRRALLTRAERLPAPSLPLMTALARIAPWAILALALAGARLLFNETGRPARLLHLLENLTLAWVVIRLTSGLARNPTLAKFIAITVWIFAALDIVGWLDPTVRALDMLSINLGHFRLSVLIVLRGIFLLTVLIWLANTAARVMDHRLQRLPKLTPAMQVLASKLARALLLTLAVVVALNAVGIDLTAFAVFSGAIGVGVGFGLQKVVSNLISGVILLLDRSIKPGDVIEIEGTYGWITRLNARFVSVSTRDGIEHLIPNEDLITHRVVNWSYTNEMVRLHAPVGISYQSDIREAIRLGIEAARNVSRVLDTPPPVCLLRNFGDNAIELELRFWIRDPRNGTANVRSEVLLNVWDRFRDHGIELPFPQRDIHSPDIARLAEAIAASVTGAGRGETNAESPKKTNGA